MIDAEKIISLYEKIPPYDSMYNSPQYISEDELTYSYILKNMKAGSILDIGCGTGCALEYLPSKKYTGIDLSPIMINDAKKKYPTCDFLVKDALEVTGMYDNIICLYGSYLHVEHIIDICYRSLSQDGQAFFHIQTPHRNQTVIGTLEKVLQIDMEVISKDKIDYLKRSFKVKIIKMNAFNKWKKNLSLPLYRLSLKIDHYLPIPMEYYTWILLHLHR